MNNFSSKYLALFCLINICLFFIVGVFCLLNAESKIYYVDNNRLFEGFKMTIKVKQDGKQLFNKNKKEVDSLYLLLQNFSKKNIQNKNAFDLFIQKKDSLDFISRQYVAIESKNVWKRIEQYSKEYFEDKDIELVVGSNGFQDTYHVNKKVDITNDLLLFINNRYEGN